MKKPATPWVVWLLGLEALLFGAGALIHAGVLYGIPEHARIATAEGIVAAMLAAGVIVSLLRFWGTRTIALTTQGLALGTLLGLFAISLGLQTRPDNFFHAILLLIMALGLMTTFKWRPYSRFRYPPPTFGRVTVSRK